MAGDTPRLIPDEVAAQEFSHGFRGYDVHEVRAFLRAAASEMARLTDEVVRLSSDLVVERQRSQATPSLSRERVTEILGEEAARVLQTAEDAGSDIQRRAEENVERMLREARAEAAEIKAAAHQQSADMLEAAESESAVALSTTSATVADAQLEADEVRSKAIDDARAMLEEAKAARKQVLGDLAGRRQRARREITQLRAGIDQLRESYDELRSLLDSSVRVLDGSIDDARQAAVSAAARFDRGDAEDDAAVVEAVVEASGQHDEDGAEAVPDPVAAPSPAPDWPDDPSLDPSVPIIQLAEAAVSGDLDVLPSEPGAEYIPDEADLPEEPGESAETDIHEETDLPEETDTPEETVESSQPIAAAPFAPDVSTVVDDIEAEADLELGAGLTTAETDGSSDADDSLEAVVADAIVTAAAVEVEREIEAVEARSESAGDRALDELEAGVDVDGEPPSLPDLLDDAPAPEPGAVPPLFGRRDSNIDELFQRIRSSREGAVAHAREVLDSDPETATTAHAADDVGGTPTPEPSVMHLDDVFADADRLDDIVSKASSALKRALADQLNEVLDARRRVSEPQVVDDILPTSLGDQLGQAVEPVVSEAGARGLRGANVPLDVSPVLAAVSADIGGALRRRVERLIGTDPDAIDARIRGIYREWRRERVDDVARQATVTAFNLGLLATVEPGSLVRWVQRNGECAVAECADNAASDPVVAGSPFPSGHVVAPASAACRCLVVPADQ